VMMTKAVRTATFRQGDVERELYIGYDVLILFMVVLLNSFLAFQFFQDPSMSQDVISIAIFQMLTGVGGLALGFVVNRRTIKIQFPTKERINETYIYGPMFASVVMMVDVLLSNAMGQSFLEYLSSFNVNIPLVAGVVEEAFISLVVTMLLYKIFAVIARGTPMADLMAMFIAAVFSGIFFALFHLYVYRDMTNILIMLFINRIIYSFVFLKYRNFSMVVMMHIFHNAIVLFM